MNKAPAIGIDLGTYQSCVAVFQNGKVDIIPNEFGERTTPSIVSFTETERLVGTTAKNKMTRNPTNTIFAAKRLIGYKFLDKEIQEDMKYWPFKVMKDPDSDRPKFLVNYKKQEKDFYAEEILAMILQKLKKSASNYIGQEIKDAVISVPNYFNTSQRQSIGDAANIAGLNVLRIINEATASCLDYGIKIEEEKENNVVIFDWGGGTLNITILFFINGIYVVQTMNGNIHLGGEDLDNKLVEYCINDFNKKTSKDIDIKKNPKAFQRIKLACEKVKRDLSSSTQSILDIDCLIGNEDLNISIGRETFEELCIDLFKKCLPPLEKALKDAKMTKNEVDEVLLIGGSTRIPKIQAMLKEFFVGNQIKISHKDEAIAYGSAIQAAIITQVEHIYIKPLVLSEVTPLSFGIETEGGLMNILISRNSEIPSKQSIILSTSEDNQSSFMVKIFEGENQLTISNNFLGKFELNGIPPMPRGQPQIKITFDLSFENLVVTAKVLSTGINNKIVISKIKNSFSKEFINKKIKEFHKFEEEEKEKEDAKINFDIYFYSMKQMIEDIKINKKISENDKNQMQKKIDEIYYWINNNVISSKEEYENKIKEMGSILNPILKKIYREDNEVLIKKEESELNLKNQNIKELNNLEEKIIAINFISQDEKILYPMACKTNDIFSKLEEKLYLEYPEYRNQNNCFTIKGKKINKSETLEKNGIKNSDAIFLNTNDKL